LFSVGIRAISAYMPTRRSPHPLARPGDDEAHVWTALISTCRPQLPFFERLLSEEERMKAARFVRPEDRARSIVAHGLLRQLLGDYLSVEPTGLNFRQNELGKPALVPCPGQPALSFNLSHSGEVILFAMTAGRRIGVDIEEIRKNFDFMEVAKGQFSEREFTALQGMSGAEQTDAFFRCWTRKEAYLKARGEGLGYPLKNFSVSISPTAPPAVEWAADDPAAAERWAVRDLAEIPGYAGAVVCEGRATRFVSRRWLAAGG